MLLSIIALCKICTIYENMYIHFVEDPGLIMNLSTLLMLSQKKLIPYIHEVIAQLFKTLSLVNQMYYR